MGEYELGLYAGFISFIRKVMMEMEPFYYWFSYSAYFTGREQLAHKCWEKLMTINPGKKDFGTLEQRTTGC